MHVNHLVQHLAHSKPPVGVSCYCFLIEHLLSASTVLGAEATTANKTDKNPWPEDAQILPRRADNESNE